MLLLSEAGLAAAAGYAEHFRTPDLSVGTYNLPAGATDTQSPHTEDELYVVTAGRAVFRTPSSSVAVAAGTVLFVPAGEPHRFTAITEDLTALVVFGPAEDTRRSA
jgi:mannose-6-phosphate isomerase-like protein (cupin superfamily)